MPRGRGRPRGRGGNGRGGHEIGRGRSAENVGDEIGVHIVEQSTTTTSPPPDLPSSSEPQPSDPSSSKPHFTEASTVGANLPTLHPNGKM